MHALGVELAIDHFGADAFIGTHAPDAPDAAEAGVKAGCPELGARRAVLISGES